jgi:thiol-disulfide isomerase/thioredoxin
VEVHAEVRELERKGFENVALTHPDLMVRRVAIDSAWIFGPSILDPLRKLAGLTPEDPWAAEKLARMEAWFEETSKIKLPQVGETILDFTGETLDGQQVRMADLRTDSRYLLVEFWASWCGPCRVEIPHMKQAYSRFRDKGFEIISFTVDDEREDWEEASAEEDLPWTDIGMGFETEAARTYKVRNSGVPANYLVDSGTGKIVAKDLRRHKLDEKLEELLN